MLLLPKSYNINLLESLVTFVLKSSRQKSLMAFFVLLMVPDWLLSLTVGNIWARRTWKWVIFYHCACGGEACCSEVCEGSEARANRRTKVREKQECASRSSSLLLGFFQPAKAVYTSSSSSRGEERRPTTAKAKRVLNFCCRSSILLALVKVVVDLNATVVFLLFQVRQRILSHQQCSSQSSLFKKGCKPSLASLLLLLHVKVSFSWVSQLLILQ